MWFYSELIIEFEIASIVMDCQVNREGIINAVFQYDRSWIGHVTSYSAPSSFDCSTSR